ncbi:hypothetical protein BD770DRAFT_442801 [Pilaira anomala]|nr:hypothetical protein BD770DRAFT_442801 [Pilaira anomala]
MSIIRKSKSIEAREPSRSEISLLAPSGKPKYFFNGSVPHSVFYALPRELSCLSVPFIKALRDMFPRGRGLGLIERESEDYLVYEVVLDNNDDCIVALDTPVSLIISGRDYVLPAYHAIAPSLELVKVHLSNISITDFDILKTRLLETFSFYGTVLDIVLYEDDVTNTWFTGNGHVYLSRKKAHYEHRDPPSVYLTGTNNSSNMVFTIWSKE